MIALHVRPASDEAIDIARIERVFAHAADPSRQFVALFGGRQVEMSGGEITRILQRPVQLLPAEPGTAVLHLYDLDCEPAAHRAPVIAWALCVDGEVRVVTANGVNDDTSEPEMGFAVLMPSGQVVLQGAGETYATEADFLAMAAKFAKLGQAHD